MTVNISFSTDYMSSEEADGVSAFIGAVRPSLLTADALRRRVDAQYGPFGGQIVGPAVLTPTPAPLGAADGSDQQSVKPEPAKPTRGTRKPKPEEVAAAADAKPAISTDPENRIDPQNPEDEAQDAADEAAETASEQPANRTITTEDVKAAIGKYVAKFQLPATQEDGPGIFKSVLGAPPAGEPYWKLSILPQDQDSLAKCEKAWLDAAGRAERTQVK